ncbi:MAG: rhodanese-like domain-containing protein [Ignavibacteriales bacterium]|nr:rhodanese-like domain-containing protein [Ignavibacteriales bacterium]
MPVKEFRDSSGSFGSISRNAILVTYCDGSECNSTFELAARISSSGYDSVKIFFGGWQAWENAQLPIEK